MTGVGKLSSCCLRTQADDHQLDAVCDVHVVMVSLLLLITSTSPCCCDYESGTLFVIPDACIQLHWLHVWCVDGGTGTQTSALLTLFLFCANVC